MSKMIDISSWIPLNVMSDVLCEALTRDQALQVILELDAQYADLDFTIKLRDKLTEAIEEELE